MKRTHSMTRRAFISGAAAATAAVTAPMIARRRHRVFAASTKEYSTRAIDLVRENLVIDMLSLVRTLEALLTDKWTLDGPQIDKIRRSGVNVFHPAIGMGGPNAHLNAYQYFLSLLSLMADHPELFVRVESSDDFEMVRTSGKVGVILGVQNADHFPSPRSVQEFYNIGQRVSQLTYNSQNRIGSGSTDRVDGGISDFGVAIVEQMNRLGMAVDVSHCGDQTTLDAFEVSSKPVLITHSNCRALVPGHPRCKTDEAIRAMAASGGVMGITGVRNFIRDREPTKLEHLVDHYDHVAKLVGVEHLGIGSDMDLDGYDDLPAESKESLKASYKGTYGFRDKIDTDGFDHPERVYGLADALIARGYNDRDIALILGGNFKRVLTTVWEGIPPKEGDEEASARGGRRGRNRE